MQTEQLEGLSFHPVLTWKQEDTGRSVDYLESDEAASEIRKIDFCTCLAFQMNYVNTLLPSPKYFGVYAQTTAFPCVFKNPCWHQQLLLIKSSIWYQEWSRMKTVHSIELRALWIRSTESSCRPVKDTPQESLGEPIPSNISISNLQGETELPFSKVTDSAKPDTEGYIRGLCCYEEETWQAEERSKDMKCNQEEVQSSVPLEEHQAPVLGVGQITGRHLCQVGPGSPGRQADREPAGCPHIKDGSEQLGLFRRSKLVLLSLCSVLVRNIWRAHSSLKLPSTREHSKGSSVKGNKDD